MRRLAIFVVLLGAVGGAVISCSREHTTIAVQNDSDQPVLIYTDERGSIATKCETLLPNDATVFVQLGKVKRLYLEGISAERSVAIDIEGGTSNEIILAASRHVSVEEDKTYGFSGGSRVIVRNETTRSVSVGIVDTVVGPVAASSIAAGMTGALEIGRGERIHRLDIASQNGSGGFRVYFAGGLKRDLIVTIPRDIPFVELPTRDPSDTDDAILDALYDWFVEHCSPPSAP